MSVKVNQMSTTANNKDIGDDIAKMRVEQGELYSPEHAIKVTTTNNKQQQVEGQE